MISLNRSASLLASVALLAVSILSIAPAGAKAFAGFNARGGGGGWSHTGVFGRSAGLGGYANGLGAGGIQGRQYNGPFGGHFGGVRGGVVTPNSGLVGGAFNATGPNGGSAVSGGVAGWQRGVGAFEGTNTSLRGPGGSTYNGFSRGTYNAQTGTGAYDANRQVYDAQNGQNYGYTDNTTYVKGQGGQTQIDTDHHGDYTVDWGNGQKPTVINDGTTAQAL